ncbi:MAG: hypothetical protein LBP36_00130 [Oscillospiraceae bacterium]|jgi:transposase-like protein|nr:hypothetical protein [Oscillospiraceae bacterium]
MEAKTLIYTANAIKDSKRQLRKVTKNKDVFPTDGSFLKIFYLAIIDIIKKMVRIGAEIRGWICSQLSIFFADRLSIRNKVLRKIQDIL